MTAPAFFDMLIVLMAPSTPAHVVASLTDPKPDPPTPAITKSK